MKQKFTLGWWAKLALSILALGGAIKINAQTNCPIPIVQNLALVPCSTGHKIQFQGINTTGATGSVRVSLGSGSNLKYEECIDIPVCSTFVTLSSACFSQGTVFDTLFKQVYPFTGCQPCISLPVNFISFNAEKNSSGGVKLFWEAEVINEPSSHFKVERSQNGITFTTIALVFADESIKKYFYTDPNPGKGKVFYRIVFANNSGTKKYTNVQLVSFEKNVEVKVFLDGTETLRIQGLPSGEIANVVVLDLSGRILKKNQSSTDNMLSSGVSVSNLPTGIYVVNVTTAKTTYSGKFFKN